MFLVVYTVFLTDKMSHTLSLDAKNLVSKTVDRYTKIKNVRSIFSSDSAFCLVARTSQADT